MNWLATWFIVELVRFVAAPDLREPQAFKKVSLKMMIDQTLTFRSIFFKNCTTFKFWRLI